MPGSPYGSHSKSGLSRRQFLAATGVAVVGVSSPAQVRVGLAQQTHPTSPSRVPEFELDEVTIAELQKGLTEGRWTSASLVEKYLGRIQELDRAGPALRHILETNPDAAKLAAELDAERKDGKVRGPLHGIPILLKDNVDTGDRMAT